MANGGDTVGDATSRYHPAQPLAHHEAREGASNRRNDELDQHPNRVRNADKWLAAVRAGIQRE